MTTWHSFLKGILICVFFYHQPKFGVSSSTLCAGKFVDEIVADDDHRQQQSAAYAAEALLQAIQNPVKNGQIINVIKLQTFDVQAAKCYMDFAGRKFEATDGNECHHFTPHGFLSLLQNRNMHIMGDSTSYQFFSSFLSAILVSDVKANWFYDEQSCKQRRIHCAVGIKGESKIIFKDYNASISYLMVQKYGPSMQIEELFHRVNVTTNDIVVFNIGVWYNDEKEFTQDIDRFFNDYASYFSNHDNQIPQYYFQESLPQHFPQGPGGKNGYYRTHLKNSFCEKIEDLDLAHQLDWRNRIIEQKIAESKMDIVHIKIADTIRTQYDYHLKSLFPEMADCTHYCMPGGVFNYEMRMLFNVIRTDPRTMKYLAAQPKLIVNKQSSQLHTARKDATSNDNNSSLSNKMYLTNA